MRSHFEPANPHGSDFCMVDPQPLASWNDGAAKSAILGFVARVTKEGSPEFAPPAERIAVFDNDGTLCCEQPLQIQFYFAFNRVKELAAKDPTMAERQPFKAVLEHDYNTLFGLGLQALYELTFGLTASSARSTADGSSTPSAQGRRWRVVSFLAPVRRSTTRSTLRRGASSRPTSTPIGLCGSTRPRPSRSILWRATSRPPAPESPAPQQSPGQSATRSSRLPASGCASFQLVGPRPTPERKP